MADKKRKLIVLIVMVVLIRLIILFFNMNSVIEEEGLKHFHEVNIENIYDLSHDEQMKILEIYNISIPQNESQAYICAFSKCDYGDGYYAYLVEFDGVENYSNFYEINAHRVDDNGLKGLSLNQLTENKNYYLTYSELLGPMDDQDIAKLFEEICNKRKSSFS